MTTRTHGADQIHPVRNGYYFKDDLGILYFFPFDNTGKRLLQLRTTPKEWTEILGEK